MYSWLNAQLKRSGICANAFRSASSRPGCVEWRGVEVAYDLKDVTDYLIGSTSEVMAYGMPYAEIGQYLIGKVDYEGICDGFYSFYSNYSEMPCGTIAVTDCS